MKLNKCFPLTQMKAAYFLALRNFVKPQSKMETISEP
jgi:hypothetical protein